MPIAARRIRIVKTAMPRNATVSPARLRKNHNFYQLPPLRVAAFSLTLFVKSILLSSLKLNLTLKFAQRIYG
jgi:hypothetical protein